MQQPGPILVFAEIDVMDFHKSIVSLSQIIWLQRVSQMI